MNVWAKYRRCKGFVPALRAVLAVLTLLFPFVARAEPVRILALGDSLTAGYGLPEPDAFTSQLQRALVGAGLEATVINAGVSGDTSAGGRARLGWAMSDKPDAMILELGANDGLRGLDPKETERNLDAILAGAKAAGLPVLLSGMKAPPNLGAEYGAEFDAVYPRLAAKHGVLFDPFFLEGVAARPELNQDDGIHPNAAGVAVIVERMLPLVLKLAAKLAGRAKKPL
jgi:acyl-CoA thioesterase-1